MITPSLTARDSEDGSLTLPPSTLLDITITASAVEGNSGTDYSSIDGRVSILLLFFYDWN